MPKAKKEIAPPPPKVLDQALHEDIVSISKAVASAITHDEDDKSIVEIPTDKLDRATDLLALTRELVRSTEADYKLKIKDIVDPFAPFAAEKKSIVKTAEALEHELEQGLQNLILTGALGPDGLETKAGTKLSLVAKRSLVIVDHNNVPDEFLLPREQCMDMGKIRAYMDAYADAAEAAAKMGESAPVNKLAGATSLNTTYSFRTKLSTEVGN